MNETLAAVLTVTAGVYLYHLIEWIYYRISDKIWEWKSKEELEKFEAFVKSMERTTKTKKK